MTKYEKAMVEQLRVDRDKAVAVASKLRAEANLRVAECRDAVETIRELHSKAATLEGALKAANESKAGQVQRLQNENEELKKSIGKLQGVAKHMINVLGNIEFGRGYSSL